MNDDDPAVQAARTVGIGPCANCGYPTDAVSPVADGDVLHAGAVIICIACGWPLVVDETPGLGMYVRPPTADEWPSLLADPVVRRVLAAQAVIAPTIAEQRRIDGD